MYLNKKELYEDCLVIIALSTLEKKGSKFFWFRSDLDFITGWVFKENDSEMYEIFI